MTDLFVGEILSLILLLPVGLRAYLRRLQRIEGIAFLPLVSLALTALCTLAFGFPLSHIPAAFCSALFFLTYAPRLSRLARGIPTDLYPPSAKIGHAFLLAALAAAIASSALYSPEPMPRFAESAVRSVSSSRTTLNERARFYSWSRAQAAQDAFVAPMARVLYVSGPIAGAKGRDTAFLLLADEGYDALSCELSRSLVSGNGLSAFPFYRSFTSRIKAVAVGGLPGQVPEWSDDHRLETQRLLDEGERRYPSLGRDRTFLVVEGTAAIPVLDYLSLSGLEPAGVAFIASESEEIDVMRHIADRKPLWRVSRVKESEAMPSGAGDSNVLVITAAKDGLFGFGEIACDDVLAAALLGGARDKGRLRAERVGRRLATWFDLRGGRR